MEKEKEQGWIGMKGYIDNINGKQIEIISFKIIRLKDNIKLDLLFNCNGNRYAAEFLNVSDICIENMNYPIQIEGFEIVSNESKGWETQFKYTVRDYEYDTFKFYCENYSISII